jgi:hypothetical protein
MILGVDLSTKAIDLVALDEDNPARCEHRRVELSQGWWHSAGLMGHILRDGKTASWIWERNVFLAGVERPYGPSRQAIASLHTILGAFLASVPPGITAFEVSPADMRRELGLPGNCAKERMHEAVIRQLKVGPAERADIKWPDDAFDAWAAGFAALRINERGTPMKEAA